MKKVILLVFILSLLGCPDYCRDTLNGEIESMSYRAGYGNNNLPESYVIYVKKFCEKSECRTYHYSSRTVSKETYSTYKVGDSYEDISEEKE